MKKSPDSSEQVSAGELPPSQPSASPFDAAFNVTVTIPQSVDIRMVDASTLADYEVWIFISSVLSSAVVGFVVAAIQDPDDIQIKIIAIMFGGLFLVAAVMALTKRHKLSAKSKKLRLQTTDVQEMR